MCCLVSANNLVLRDVGLIHADIKPHNIALVCADRDIVTQNDTKRIKLTHVEIRLIDFSSAVPGNSTQHKTAITKAYRAPEFLLSLGFSYPYDIWSTGCVLVELYLGRQLFRKPCDKLIHLAAMLAVCGQTKSTIKQAVKYFKNYFEPSAWK